MSILDSISNREMNIAATLVINIGVAVYYAVELLAMPGGIDFTSAAMAGIIGKIIVVTIVISIVVFSAINWRKGEEKTDERDYRIETQANTFAYVTLAVCTALILGHIILNEVFAGFAKNPSPYVIPLSPMFIAHLLLLALLLASTFKAVAQLVLYRRNAG